MYDSTELAPFCIAPQEHPKALSWRQLTGLILGPGLIYAIIIYRAASFEEGELIARDASAIWTIALTYFLVGGGWLYFVLRYVCQDTLNSLNLRFSRWYIDILEGVGLFILLLYGVGTVNALIWPILWQWETSALTEMTEGIRSSIAVLVAMELPYNWLAAAVLEEFNRVFLLSRLFKLLPASEWKVGVVVFGATLFGLGHLYYGAYGAISTGTFGLLACAYYALRGRVLPLIIAHGLYGNYSSIVNYYWY